MIGDLAAVEIKAFESFSERSLTGLKALQSEQKIQRYYLVSRDPIRRKVDGTTVLPYTEFLDLLWAGDICD